MKQIGNGFFLWLAEAFLFINLLTTPLCMAKAGAVAPIAVQAMPPLQDGNLGQFPTDIGAPAPNTGIGQISQASAVPKANTLAFDLSGWLQAEAQKSTDSADSVKTVALLISAVTVIIALAGIVQQINEKRWKDDLREEQKKLEISLSSMISLNRESINEIKREILAARDEMRSDLKDTRMEARAESERHREEIGRIRADAKERVEDIRSVVLYETGVEATKNWESELKKWNRQVSTQVETSMDKTINEAGSQHANLLYRVELVRSALMAEISRGLPSEPVQEAIMALIERLHLHQRQSLALIQLLSQQDGVLATGLGTFLDRGDQMPASFFDLLIELNKMKRFTAAEPTRLFERLMRNYPIAEQHSDGVA